MSFLSGIGNIFHSIGSLFDGGDNDPRKKQQQMQTVQPTHQAAPQVFQPTQNPVAQASQQSQQPNNAVNLTQLNPTTAPAHTLAKAQPATKPLAPPTPTPTQPAPQTIAPKPDTTVTPTNNLGGTNGFTPLVKVIAAKPNPLGPNAPTGPTDWKGVGRAALAAPASTAISAAKGVTDLYDLLTPGKGENRVSQALDHANTGLVKFVGNGEGAQDALRMGNTALMPTTFIGPGEAVGAIKGTHALEDISSETPRVVTGLQKAKGIINKVIPGRDGMPTPEVPGVRSVNPNREADAAAQMTAQAPQPVQPQPIQVDDTPAFMRAPQKAEQATQERQAVVDAANEHGAAPTPLDTTPTFQHRQAIQDVINQGNDELNSFVSEHPNATPADIEAAHQSITEQVAQKIGEMNAARAGQAADTPLPEPVQPEVAPAPAPQPTTPEIVPEPARDVAPQPPITPAVLQEAEKAVPAGPGSQATAEVPTTPPDTIPAPVQTPELPSGGDLVPTAPNTRSAIVKQLGDAAKTLPGDGKLRETTNLDDLKQSAAGHIANLDDEQVVQAFSSPKLDGVPSDVKGVALLRAAIDRLSTMDINNPDVADALENALDGIAERSSNSGLIQRFVQEDFDKLPLPMKVRYIVRQIDRANKDTKDYSPLADNPDKADLIERQITNYLKDSEVISNRVAATQGKLEAIAEQAKNGQKTTEDISALAHQLRADQRALQANNGELVKYYQTLVPQRALGQKVNDFARTMMLSSFSGRLNDIATTSLNMVEHGLNNVTQGVLAKAVNLFSPGKVTDTLRGGKQFVQGAASGLRKSANEFGGTHFSGDLQKALKNETDVRTGMTKANKGLGRFVQNATEVATRGSEGVRDQRVYQLAVQEAQQAGLKGKMLKQYAEARASVPSKVMLDRAEQLHREVNNLNDNPISTALNKISKAIDPPEAATTTGQKAGRFFGGLLKNQVMPFTSWLGGNIWNSLTDKNVVASLAKTMYYAGKGDAEGIVSNLSKTITHGAEAYALGYLMTQHGLITNQDANGYNDGGAYLHLGDRYIPVGFLGFFAPNIILGNAAYQGINSGNGSPSKTIADTAEKALTNLAKSVNVAGAVGADSALSKSITTLNQPGSTTNAKDASAQLGSNAAGEFIPAATGDVNAVLNNHSPLNPTHEAADTKVVQNKLTKSGKPSTAKDIAASSLKSLENRIPIASQQLPRKAGVSAADLTDRVTHGNRDTTATKTARTDAATKLSQDEFDKKNDIPNPDGSYKSGESFDKAIQARAERGEYDKAINGLQQQLKEKQQDKNLPESDLKALKDHITQLTILKGGKFDYSIVDQYKSTSVSEWRNMGDPKSDTYDPKMYKALYDYDTALAKAGISGSTLSKDDNKYTAKKPSAASGARSAKSARAAALKKITSNTIGSTPTLSRITLGNLAPEKVASGKLPTIQQVQPGDLIKKRAISISKVR